MIDPRETLAFTAADCLGKLPVDWILSGCWLRPTDRPLDDPEPPAPCGQHAYRDWSCVLAPPLRITPPGLAPGAIVHVPAHPRKPPTHTATPVPFFPPLPIPRPITAAAPISPELSSARDALTAPVTSNMDKPMTSTSQAVDAAQPFLSGTTEAIVVLLLLIALGWWLGRRGLELLALTSYRGRRRLRQMLDEAQTREAERKRQAEWNRHARMPPGRFAAEQKQRGAAIDMHADAADDLYDAADEIEAGWIQLPILTRFYVRHLRSRANRHIDLGNALQDEIERLDALYQEVIAARAIQRRQQAKANFAYLVGLLESENTTTAEIALRQLQKVRRAIDLTILVPDELPVQARAQAAKLLAMMCGTNSVNECRAALGRLRRLLSDNNCPFERMAA